MNKLPLRMLTSAFILTASCAIAADIRLVPTGTPLDLVVLEGKIVQGDSDRFLETVRATEIGAVLLKSPGGNLVEGLVIGRAIRASGFSTGVAPGTACASACALAWLGGETRYMDPTALVGFHAAYITKNGRISESGVGNALVGAYLSELGLGFDAVVFVSSAAPNEMNWLNAAKAQQAGINVVMLEADGSETPIGKEIALKLPSGFRWIVLESSTSPETLKTAEYSDQIVRTQNGYFASVIGPYEQSVAKKMMLTMSFIPGDAYLSSGNGFLFSLSK
ncbi:hypothetical protein [Litorivita sp. NS0012-18]|uniref:COG3904 family protein n=1 Tax=Litorivita sp. NS0012-18 TaxID=3127655 RepID=UPI003105A5D4